MGGRSDRRRPAGRPAVAPLEPRVLFAAYVAGNATAYATIQAAVNAAPAGGTVTVTAGTYAEQVTVTKALTLKGAQAGTDARGGGRPTAGAATESVVTGAAGSNGRSSAFHVLADDVTVDGFTVTGETDPDEQLGAGVVVGPRQSGVHLLDDVIRGNVSGIFLANSSGTDAAVVQHCYVASNNNDGANGGRGIYTDGTVSGGNLTDVTIDANTFANNLGGDGTTGLEAALAFEAGTAGRQSAIRITNNAFAGNGKAVLFFNAANVLIEGNTVTNCQDQWSGSLRFEGNVNTVSILYNTVTGNTGPGVAVDSKGMAGDNYGFVVNDNNFAGNNAAYAVPISVANNFDTYDGAFDARYNYWGAASGPSGYGPGGGDAVGGGFMQIGTGKGWALTAGGNMLYGPWATATVSPTATAPAAPSGLTATAAATAPQVALAWTDNAAGNETRFVVQRSADGGATFAPVATTAAGVTAYADAAGLAAGTAYAYRVLAINATGTSAPSNVATATTAAAATPTPTPTGTTTYVSTLAWASATAGWGTVQTDKSIKGSPITLRGTVYPKGLGTHAASTITYNLAGAYTNFLADVGIDDETAGQGLVDFKVVGDGVTLYDSGNLTGSAAVGHVSVSVAGVKTLQLVATHGVAGSIDFDHADWAGARLVAAAVTGTPVIPTAPANLVATAVGSAEVDLTWAATSAAQTGYEVDRSTDGGATFTRLATTTAAAYADAAVAAATKYVYRVLAYNAAGSSPASNTATATTAAAGTSTSMSDLTWTSATTGYGAVHKDASVNGNAITLHGTKYAKGIGTHAVSTITYALAGRFATFLSDVGVDDEVTASGSIDFKVVGDGVTLYDSGVLTGASPAAHVSVSVAGVKTLQLVATNGVAGSIDYDHADWAGARLLSTAAATVPVAPTGVAVKVVSKSALTVSWAAVADATVTGYEVQRSTDGTTFAAVATVGPAVTTFANAGLTAAKKYYYRVVAMNAVGRSVASAVVSATTPVV